MEEKSPSAFKATLTYGILLGVAMIVLHLVMFLLDMHKNQNLSYITLVLILIGMTVGTIDYRNKKLNGFISYGQAVKIGFLTILFAAIVSAVYTYIFYSAISPGDLQDIRMEQAQDVYNRNLDPDAEAQMLKWQGYFITPFVLSFGSVIFYAIPGILIALFIAIFLKKEEKVNLS